MHARRALCYLRSIPFPLLFLSSSSRSIQTSQVLTRYNIKKNRPVLLSFWLLVHFLHNVLSVSKNGDSRAGGAHWWSTCVACTGLWVPPQQLHWILLISAPSEISQPLSSSCPSYSILSLLAATKTCTGEPRSLPRLLLGALFSSVS